MRSYSAIGRGRRITGALVATVLAAACSSSTPAKSGTGSTTPSTLATAASTSSSTGSGGHPCNRPVAAPPTVTPVAGSASDKTMVSFDGTRIRLHWFPVAGASAAHPAPTVLMGPGWGSGGDTNVTPTGGGEGVFGALSIDGLHAHGYNVLTWDPRGFGKSTGTVTTDDPQHEGRDVERMLDWLATQPGVELDKPGDPRVGMAGGSYGGGIQLAVAAIDCRVDAIAPWIAWNSLGTSLYKSGVAKTGWGNLLYGIAAGRNLDPHITSAWRSSNRIGAVNAADHAWFVEPWSRPADQPGRRTDPVRAGHRRHAVHARRGDHELPVTAQPRRAYRDALVLRRPRRVPHAARRCRRARSRDACVARPLRAAQAGGARPALRDGRPTRCHLHRARLPDPHARRPHRNHERHAQPRAFGRVRAGKPPKGSTDPLAGIAGGITPALASNAVNLRIVSPNATEVIAGAPMLTLRYSGTVPAGTRPTAVFAQLVDNTTGLVIGNQVTPVALTLDGRTHTLTVPLESIAFTFERGRDVTAQIVATTVAYGTPRLGGKVTMQATVSLPVSTLTPR